MGLANLYISCVNIINKKESCHNVSLDAINLDYALCSLYTDILEEYKSRKERTAINRAIRKLLPIRQELINRIFFEGMSETEIARREGVNKLIISYRLDRALKEMKKLLE